MNHKWGIKKCKWKATNQRHPGNHNFSKEKRKSSPGTMNDRIIWDIQKAKKVQSQKTMDNKIAVVNPRRACAARVTVVVLCVCLSVCLSVCQQLFSHYRQRGCPWAIPSSELREPENLLSAFSWNDCVRERDTGAVADRVAWPNLSISCAHAYICAFEMYGAADHDCDSDQVRSLCVSWRHNKSQRRACIDSRTLFTTVASPCQTLCELLVGETHTDSPAHQFSGMVHAQFAEGLHFSAFHFTRSHVGMKSTKVQTLGGDGRVR